MKKEIQEITMPFKWQGWDGIDILLNYYYDVTFTEDFGTFKKGDVFESIMVDYQNGFIESYDKEGNVLKTQKIKWFPID
jgi:hypothetical protein